MIAIDKTFNGKKISTQKGDVLKLQLAENPTTGYRWKVNRFDDKHLNTTKKEYEVSSEAIGTGGQIFFYIEVISEGTSEVHIELINDWEIDTVDTFKLTVES